MNVLLTGATGFVGSHLTRALLARDHHVFSYRRPDSSFRRLKESAARITWFDLDPARIHIAFQAAGGIDLVIHTATAYGHGKDSSSSLIEANMLLTLRIFEAAVAAGTPRFINTDSFFTVQHPHYSHLPGYSLTKHQVVEWLRQLAGPTRVCNLRLEHIYGPHDDEKKFITHISFQCVANTPEIALSPGEQCRDFTYIDDVVDAYLLAVENPDATAETFAEYQLGSGRAVSLREAVKCIHRLASSTSHLHFGALPYRPGELMFSQADIAPLAALGWSPRWSLEAGLEQTVRDAETRLRS